MSPARGERRVQCVRRDFGSVAPAGARDERRRMWVGGIASHGFCSAEAAFASPVATHTRPVGTLGRREEEEHRVCHGKGGLERSRCFGQRGWGGGVKRRGNGRGGGGDACRGLGSEGAAVCSHGWSGVSPRNPWEGGAPSTEPREGRKTCRGARMGDARSLSPLRGSGGRRRRSWGCRLLRVPLARSGLRSTRSYKRASHWDALTKRPEYLTLPPIYSRIWIHSSPINSSESDDTLDEYIVS